MQDFYGEMRSILSFKSFADYYEAHLKRFYDEAEKLTPQLQFYREKALGAILAQVEDPVEQGNLITYLMSHPQVRSHEVSLAQILRFQDSKTLLVEPKHLFSEVLSVQERLVTTSYYLPFDFELFLWDKGGLSIAEVMDPQQGRFKVTAFTEEEAFTNALLKVLDYTPHGRLGRLNQWLKRGQPANLFGIPKAEDIAKITSWGDIVVRDHITEDTYRADVPPDEGDAICIGEHIFVLDQSSWTEELWSGDVLSVPSYNTVEELKEHLLQVWEWQNQTDKVYHEHWFKRIINE